MIDMVKKQPGVEELSTGMDYLFNSVVLKFCHQKSCVPV